MGGCCSAIVLGLSAILATECDVERSLGICSIRLHFRFRYKLHSRAVNRKETRATYFLIPRIYCSTAIAFKMLQDDRPLIRSIYWNSKEEKRRFPEVNEKTPGVCTESGILNQFPGNTIDLFHLWLHNLITLHLLLHVCVRRNVFIVAFIELFLSDHSLSPQTPHRHPDILSLSFCSRRLTYRKWVYCVTTRRVFR